VPAIDPDILALQIGNGIVNGSTVNDHPTGKLLNRLKVKVSGLSPNSSFTQLSDERCDR
jgi:hypothetical protein